ncbi:flagellar hook-basal body complex protein FliE [Notoacmeibacter sp. MSK16QG-6]|uniref:flagellar hook-basal body complex protein FliE n=1 Tax=Notoacmeibacter sp. MSK16QG-6 TaxID=2957982 RepID=UPI0020A20078|nr:flagellar hook-basal body complex protein FliE [Notoacmeibacter sp. MSK16QG-6]MCP1200915.1 flagellar hook-basal body complex protein FliE [Notoacmeibacter sp. MSK16QG-6]
MIEKLSAIAATRITPAAGAGGAPASSGAVASDFASALAQGANNVADQVSEADRAAMSALSGQSGPREVAEAVMTAEQSLQTAIAVRDKLVNAFLDISRMQI